MNISLETKGKIVKSIVLCLGIVLVFLLAFFIIKIYTTDYTVTFMNEDNSVIETRKVRTGNSVIEPAEPRRRLPGDSTCHASFTFPVFCVRKLTSIADAAA